MNSASIIRQAHTDLHAHTQPRPKTTPRKNQDNFSELVGLTPIPNPRPGGASALDNMPPIDITIGSDGNPHRRHRIGADGEPLRHRKLAGRWPPTLIEVGDANEEKKINGTLPAFNAPSPVIDAQQFIDPVPMPAVDVEPVLLPFTMMPAIKT